MSNRFVNVTILNGAATSDTINLQPHERLVGVIQKSNTWTAADIGFAVSDDGSTFYRTVDAARSTAATSHARVINVETTNAPRYYLVPECFDMEVGAFIKFTSINTASNADVNQGQDVSLTAVIMTGH